VVAAAGALMTRCIVPTAHKPSSISRSTRFRRLFFGAIIGIMERRWDRMGWDGMRC